MRTRAGSFRHRRYLFAALLAGSVGVAAGAAAGALPSLASSTAEPTVSAICASECSSFYPKYAWSPSEAAVGAGGKVVFANTTPGTPHGIVWSSAAKPSCEGSVPVGATQSSAEAWSGACTFSQPGTYTYYCSVHGLAMSGTITVSSEGTTTTAPAPTTTTGGGTTTTTPSPPPVAHESLLAGPAANALKLAKSQRGGRVRGSIALSQAASGGKLQIEVLAPRAALADGRHSALASVGRLARKPLSAGVFPFAIRLNARARRALTHRRHLTLRVSISIVSPSGERLTISRSVVERV